MLSLIAVLPLLASIHASPLTKRASTQIVYATRDNLCLSLEGGNSKYPADGSGTPPTDGTPVISIDCDDASVWNISPGSGSITVAGYEGFALDAGSNPANFGSLKVWTSYPGLYQQTWYYTDDHRIAITGGDQCLDEGDNGVQTYQCTTGNTNQIWENQTPTPRNNPQPITTTTSTPTSTSTSATSSSTSIPTGVVYPDPAGGGHRIHPNGRDDLCVTVQNGYAAIGTAVQISYCFADPSSTAQNFQLFDLPDVGTAGNVQLHGTDLCLDAGDDPANASGIKVWTCGDGWLQQTWTFEAANRLSLGNGQCLDVVAGSGPINAKPYGSEEELQTWACSNNGDPQQVFYVV